MLTDRICCEEVESLPSGFQIEEEEEVLTEEP